MYKITDVVEMGHSPLIGGSITISLEFNDILTKNNRDLYLKIIDALDHCLVTDNKDMIKHSARFFLLDESKSLFEDIHTILYYFVKRECRCTVTIGKESFTEKLRSYSGLLKYNYKG